MPYIIKDRRKEITFKTVADGLCVAMNQINTSGELNYAITEILINYLNRKGISYTNMNEVVGVLECAKLELYRRMIASYENIKIEENGDVY